MLNCFAVEHQLESGVAVDVVRLEAIGWVFEQVDVSAGQLVNEVQIVDVGVFDGEG